MEDTLILAIESSCDETAASVVKNGRTILSNVISSQIELHKLYGGVVPEIASRKHIEKVNQVIEEDVYKRQGVYRISWKQDRVSFSADQTWSKSCGYRRICCGKPQTEKDGI